MSTKTVIYVTVCAEMFERENPRELLAACPLFSTLDFATVDRICSRYHIGIEHHEAGTVVMLRGEVYDRLLFVARGCLVAYIDDLSGKVLQLETLPAPSVVASAIFFSDGQRLPVSLSATEPTTLFGFARSVILEIARENASFLDSLLTDMGNRATFLGSRLRMTQFARIEQKLAVYLTELMRQTNRHEITLPHTKQQISEIFGVTRPALSRVFGKLAMRGIIAYDAHTVTVLDEAALDALRIDAT